jgi:hypothetical protein
MSGPVDVLAAMRKAEAYCYDAGASQAAADVKDARAAVTELILRADHAATALSNLIAARKVAVRYGDYVTDLTAATARCKGATP